MAATLTFEQMYAQILEQDAAKFDLVADTRRMSSIVAPLVEDGPNALVLDVDAPLGLESFIMGDYARGQISTDLGIPKKYFDRMLQDAPSLLQKNVDHWLYNQPERRLVRGFRNLDTPNITGRAWLSDKYRRLDNIELAKRVFPVFDDVPGLRFYQAALTDTRFHVRALLPRLEREVGLGDIVQCGIEIRNSEVGNGALVVQPFIFRLICLNGMTVQDHAVRKNHVGKRIEDEDQFSAEALEADDTAFWLMVRDTVKATLTEVRFDQIVNQLIETRTGQKVEAPARATEQLQNKFGLTDVERERVLANLIEGGDTSQWGLLNAVTATAKQADDFDRQAELEALGWTVGSLRGKEWDALAVA